MKLEIIRFMTRAYLPGVPPNEGTELKLASPPESMRGWRVYIRGPEIAFVSPPGWHKERLFKDGKTGAQESEDGTRFVAGSRVIHTMPRDLVRLEWSAPTACDGKTGEIDDKPFEKSLGDAIKSYVSEPMGPPLPAAEPQEKPRLGSLAAQLAKPVPPHEQGDD